MNRKNLFFFIISISLFIFTLGSAKYIQKTKYDQTIMFLYNQARQTKSGFLSALRFHKKAFVHLAEFIALDEAIINTFEKGIAAAIFEGGGAGGEKTSKLRNKLHEIVARPWNAIRKSSGYRQLHFHYGPDITSFLRVHKPSKFGDKLCDIRHILKNSFDKDKQFSGFEIGRIISGIRGVCPVSSIKTGRVIGTIETGSSFDTILDSLKNEFNADYTVFLKEKILKECILPDILPGLLKKNPLLNKFYTEASTGPEYKKIFDKQILDNLWNQRGNKTTQYLKIIKKNNKIWAVTSFPLRDYLGTIDKNWPDIGMVISYSEVTPIFLKLKNQAQRYNITAFISYIILVILLYLGLFVNTSLVDKKIFKKGLFKNLFIYIGTFLLGSSILVLISMVQKLYSNVSINVNTLIFPFFFGGCLGLVVYSLTKNLTLKKIELENILEQQQKDEKVRLAIEKQIYESRRLESLGVMAGGIAHDFNNLLMGIFGNIQNIRADFTAFFKNYDDNNRELIKEENNELNSQIIDSLDLIDVASNQAVELCSKILAYTGSINSVHTPVDLNDFIMEIMPVIKLSVSDNTHINIDLCQTKLPIQCDSQQLTQLVVNLALNASEAYKNCRGQILIKTSVETDEKSSCPILEIIDSGCGMPSNVLERIYDPFFTTKFTGRGLGMAAVHGIMRIHKAIVTIESKQGEGTKIKICFPCRKDFNNSEIPSFATIDVPPKNSEEPEIIKPSELLETASPELNTILLVDDDELVRKTASKLINHCGFTVITATNGKEGLNTFNNKRSIIKTIFLDLTMPEMDGLVAFKEFRKIDPDISITIISGFCEKDIDSVMKNDKNVHFLHKPFSLASLKKNLSEI